MGDDFFSFCEELWTKWASGNLSPPISSPNGNRRNNGRFDIDSLPEPYFWLSHGKEPLVALLTNPGRSMPHQARASVCADHEAVPKRYESFAIALGHVYTDEEEDADVARSRLIEFADKPLDVKNAFRILYSGYTKLRGAARSRNNKMKELARRAGFDGVLVVECCPFHSKTFNKRSAIKLNADDFLKEYRRHLATFLKPYPVAAVAAAPSEDSLDKEAAFKHEWLSWLADLIGIERDASFLGINFRAGKTTTAALVGSVAGVPKALSMMMGSNNLPALDGLEVLAKEIAIRRRKIV